jgi:SAM-dependent methyltransferase
MADGSRSFYESLASNRRPLELELRLKRTEIASLGLLGRVFEEVRRHFGGESIGRVIEVGAGDASNLVLLGETFKVRERIALDLVLPREESPEGVKFVPCPAAKIRDYIAPGSVDLALMLEVIEHLWDPDEAIAQIRETLGPQGIVIISTPNLSSLVNRLALLVGLQPLSTEVSTAQVFGRPARESPVGHIRNFTFRSLLDFLDYHELDVVSAYTVADSFPGVETGWIRVVRLTDRFATFASARLASRTIVVAKSRSRHT